MKFLSQLDPWIGRLISQEPTPSGEDSEVTIAQTPPPPRARVPEVTISQTPPPPRLRVPVVLQKLFERIAAVLKLTKRQ